MNPNIRIEAMTEKMCPENQKLMDKISGEIRGVINALDNIAARRYMDEQCFKFGLPLFESGTQGMKLSSQSVIPNLTDTYSNSSDPPQGLHRTGSSPSPREACRDGRPRG
mgnify:CR=1 FL=1